MPTEIALQTALEIIRHAEEEVEAHAMIGNQHWCRVTIRRTGNGHIHYSLAADRLVFKDARGHRRCCYDFANSRDQAIWKIMDAAGRRSEIHDREKDR